MRRLQCVLLLTCCLGAPVTLDARESHSGAVRFGVASSAKWSSSNPSHSTKSTNAQNAKRDERGRIARSKKAKDDFKKQHPCPSTGKTNGACPGYVIDHIKPLKRGGPDAPSNMQWQTTEEARIKDRTE